MQLHKRLELSQVLLVLNWYKEKKVSLGDALLKLNIKKRRFFYLLKQEKAGQLAAHSFGKRAVKACNRIPGKVEAVIKAELLKEQELIQNPDIPITQYNYSHVTDEVVKRCERPISAETVRTRAHQWGFAIEGNRKRIKAHDRFVLTEEVGTLLQHDSSFHLFAPLGKEKWHLITTIEDYSRALLVARLLEPETAWDHILAIKEVCLNFGIPGNYYVDNHSIFRFVERMESFWRTPKVDHATVLTAWETVLKTLGIGVFHALSPQAKGKIERPYRWLQDRLVRRCCKEQVVSLPAAQAILDEEVRRYNYQTVHSTTGEVPMLRFNAAVKAGKSVFKKFGIPAPLRALEDVFCLREKRVVSGYHTVVWRNHHLPIPKQVPIGAEVTICVVPDSVKPCLRLWCDGELVDVVFLSPHH